MNTATKQASRSSLSRVDIAWPTLALAAVVLTLFVGVVAGLATGLLPLWAALLIQTWAAFAAFTVMHDASHRAVSKHRWLNEGVARLASVVLVAPFGALRHLHLEHHKHTNDPEKDPDFYAGEGPRWQLPLRWLTQDIHYYGRYFRVLRKRPRAEAVETVATLAIFIAAAAVLASQGYAVEVLVGWLLPSRLAIALLAFSFDYLPHRPHDVPARENRFQATAILEDAWLTPLMLCQNHHLIHHLYPAVPFYRYPVVWRERRDELLAKGAKVVRIVDADAPDGRASIAA